MESLLDIVDSLPIWVKISIPFIGSFVYFLAYDLIKCGLAHVAIVDDMKSAIKTVVFNIPAYISIIIIGGIVQFVLSIWNIHVWLFIIKHIWTLFYIFLVFMHIYVAIAPDKPKSAFHSYGAISPTFKNESNKPLSDTKKSVKTVVVPVTKPIIT